MFLSRRDALKAIGATTALGFSQNLFSQETESHKKRIVMIGVEYGHLNFNFRPKNYGTNFTLSPYLEMIKEHRKELSVFSGMSHTKSPGSHNFPPYTFTGAHFSTGNTISLDQLMSMKIGHSTRFNSMALGIGAYSLSRSATGAGVPAIRNPKALYDLIYRNLTDKEVEEEKKKLKSKISKIKHYVKDDKYSKSDLMNAYEEMIARVEKKIKWLEVKKPENILGISNDSLEMEKDYEAYANRIFDLVVAAIQTDSSRIFNINFATLGNFKYGTHYLTHSCGNKELRQVLVDEEKIHFRVLNRFLKKLKGIKENGRSLFDNTTIMTVGGMTSANSHSSRNLPVMLLGGGINHLGNVSLPQLLDLPKGQEYPLNNLYLTILNEFKIPSQRFGCNGTEILGALQWNA